MSGAGLRLAFRLALRELRGGLSGFRIFVLSLALGVAAIAAVGAVGSSVDRGLRADARALLGGDVELQLVQRPPSAAERAFLDASTARLSEAVEMRAMAHAPDPSGRRALVELKAVDAAYPLVGAVALGPPGDLQQVLARQADAWGAVAEPALFERLGVGVGERIRVGEATFVLRASIAHEPDRIASVVSFGPRLMISSAALSATGLVQPGSLIRWNLRLLLAADIDPARWTAALKQALPTAGWQIRASTEAAPGVMRFIDRLATFLNFAGLSALLIGGLGVAGAVRNYLAGKVETIAMLKCLGAPGGLVATIYLLQIMILALLGVGLGLVAGALVPTAVLALLADHLPVRLEPGVAALPLLRAAALGLLTALTFALWPLGRARDVRAANLFRTAAAEARGRPRRAYAVAAAFCALALAGLAVLSVSDRGLGLWFVAGAIATLAILRASAAGVLAAFARLPRPRGTALRMAVANLRRPGAPTPAVMTSLGAGLTVLVAVALIDSNMRAQIGERLPAAAPAFFFIDIQNDQADVFDAAVRGVSGVTHIESAPALRGRIVAIKGVPVEQAPVAPESAWAVRGDRGLTYAATQPADAKITAGSWWPADYQGPPLVSLDAGIARGFGTGVGDTLTLNVLGREITVHIASLREIEWRALPFDFALILDPATLTGAPQTHIAAVYADVSAEAAIERVVGDRFANVTAIRTREVLGTVNELMQKIGWGVRAAAAVTLLAGALVLAGAIAADRRQRRGEAVLYKVLGATRQRLLGIYAIEYGVLGLITAVVAAALGTAVAWAVTTQLMQFDWAMRADVVVAIALASVALALTAGFAGTWRSLGLKAAPLLRNA